MVGEWSERNTAYGKSDGTILIAAWDFSLAKALDIPQQQLCYVRIHHETCLYKYMAKNSTIIVLGAMNNLPCNILFLHKTVITLFKIAQYSGIT